MAQTVKPAAPRPAAQGPAPQPIADEPGSPRHSDKSTLTPAMRQYAEQKAQVGDAILLFRMGDFYETFYEDARTIARVLGLTLTARDKNSASPVPLAGVPYHAVDRYVARLIRAGYKVAISEQMEDPRLAKTVVQRDIVRIITPGTLTDEALLEENQENMLAAITPGSGRGGRQVGLAWVELASGRFFARMIEERELEDELARLKPAEVLAPEQSIDSQHPLINSLRRLPGVAFTPRPAQRFERRTGERVLLEHFGVASLAGFGFDHFDDSLGAAAGLIDYLQETQRAGLRHVARITPFRAASHVLIDQFTLRSLEIERSLRDESRAGSLLAAMDATCTSMGARRLRHWLCFPLRDLADIRARQRGVAALREAPAKLKHVRTILSRVGDIERICARVSLGRALPRDFLALGQGLVLCPLLREELAALADAGGETLVTIAEAADGHESLGNTLTAAIRPEALGPASAGDFIADRHDADLDRLRQISRNGREALAEFQAREAARTGIPSLKVKYNSVFGYYIEITHQHHDKVPPEYVRRQTVRNAERYVTEELKRHEEDITHAADRAREREHTLFEELRNRVLAELDPLQRLADQLATLDVLCAFAERSRARGYCRPEWVEDADGPLLEIRDGRHPVLDETLGDRFVPNDCHLSPAGDRLAIITGPNMAGKSTYIRQVALLTMLAHAGSDVPAAAMRLSPIDRLFARIGASDEIAKGQSTFMIEMIETARILNDATEKSLVILDEIGRGTSTYDGLAIAWAVTEFLAQRPRCRTLFATHYHELTQLAERVAGVANFNVAVQEELRPDGTGRNIVFLHRIRPGPSDRSYGVHVAELAGLPRAVIRRSEQVLRQLEERKAPRGSSAPEGGKVEAGPTLFDAACDEPSFVGAGVPDLPPAYRQMRELLESLRIDETTPLEALALLQRLQALTIAGS